MIRDPITTAEAARIIGISDSYVRVLIAAGRLTAERFGNKSHILSRKQVTAFKRVPRGRPKNS